MNPTEQFENEVRENVKRLRSDVDLQAFSRVWVREVTPYRYAHNFSWLGRPIIQLPQDIIAMQEIVWRVKPDLLIETGVAHGGSLIFYASLFELMGHGQVIGIDIDIRPHNREAIESHVMSKRIRLIQGSSISEEVIKACRQSSAGKRVIVVLDSNHTHDHVLAELRAYAPLVSVGSYCVVMDTVIADVPEQILGNRPWGAGSNPKSAVHEFLREDDRFQIDRDIEAKCLITVAPDGYLIRGQ